MPAPVRVGVGSLPHRPARASADVDGVLLPPGAPCEEEKGEGGQQQGWGGGQPSMFIHKVRGWQEETEK